MAWARLIDAPFEAESLVGRSLTRQPGERCHIDSRCSAFASQPSQKDGLGRMCKTHWNRYTAGLARDAKARKAAVGGAVTEASVAAADDAVPAPKAKAPRARKGGPVGYLGSEPGGPVELLPGGTKRRVAPTPKGSREIAPANDGGGQSPD